MIVDYVEINILFKMRESIKHDPYCKYLFGLFSLFLVFWRITLFFKPCQKFYCGGRLVFGPDASSLFLSSFLIGAPAISFCIRMLVRIEEHDPLYGYGVLITGCVLTFLVCYQQRFGYTT